MPRIKPLISVLILILLVAIFLTSCDSYYSNLLEENEEPQSDSQTPNDQSESSTTPSATQFVPPEEENNFITNNVTIDGETIDVKYSTAKGLRSAVSVYCSFKKTVLTGSMWNPVQQTQEYYSTGSGVIYRTESDGSMFVITNFHVIYDIESDETDHISNNISLYLYGMENEAYAIPASYVGGSANYDIAILRVDKNDVLKWAFEEGSAVAVSVGNSDLVVPGEATVAIGNPSTTTISGISVTKGIVSVDSEYISMTAVDESGTVSCRVIRTDTPVNPGNSGGGLFNSKGELIGIVNAKSTISNIDNIGYAIPSNVARGIADNIIDNCYGNENKNIIRGVFGGSIKINRCYSVYDENTGLMIKVEEIAVNEITSGGFADGLLQIEDVIKSITIGDKTIDVYRQHHLIDAMFDFREGETVSFKIYRGGEEITVSKVVSEKNLAKN